MYIYMRCRVKNCSNLGRGGYVKNWSKIYVKDWSKFFTVFLIFRVFWGMLKNTRSVNLCQKIVFLSGCQIEVFEKNAFFVFVSFLCCCKRNRRKKKIKWKKNPKKQKHVFYGGHPKMRTMKRMDFSKDCLTRFVSGREKSASENQKSNKIGDFSGNCPKPKTTPFFEKLKEKLFL